MTANHSPSQRPAPHALPPTLAILALLCLALGLPSCSSSPTPPAQTTSPAPSTSASSAPTASTSPRSEASPATDANKSQETKAIESSIITTLSQQIPSPITAANCPNVEKLEAGKTFDCDLTIAEGHFPATVTLKDTNGGFGVNTKNLLLIGTVEKQLPDLIKKENQIDAKVDCGPSKVRIFKNIGETFECNLTQPNGKAGTATITATTLAGGVDAKWKLEQ